MSEINPISPSYPINRPKKVDPERQKSRQKDPEKKKNDGQQSSNEPSDTPHIDEVV